MEYNRQYFIDKFSAIPDEQWISGDLHDENTGASCALGHCGVRQGNGGAYKYTPEAEALIKVLTPKSRQDYAIVVNAHFVTDANDNESLSGEQICDESSTPRERILIKLLEEDGI